MLAADRLELQDHAGGFLRWITPEEGRRFVDERKIGEYRGTKRKHRAVQLVRTLTEPELEECGMLPLGSRYVHNRETPENPHGVWTLKRIAPSLKPYFSLEVA